MNTVLPMASKMFLYGSLPSGPAFIACNLVLALSNGRAEETATKLAMNFAINVVIPGLSGKMIDNLSFNSSYVENNAQFNTIALEMVGTPPFHSDVSPSSAGILFAALKTDV